MILGPTGCGKSTLLASLARDYAAGRAGTPTPTVFLQLRLPSSQAPLPEGVNSNNLMSLTEAHKLMDSVAAQVFRPIGYPLRRALVFSVPRALNMQLSTKFGVSADFTSPSSHRVYDALRLLFDVLEELYHERAQAGSMPRGDAPPVLLVDEAQDLIKVSRLAAVGGRAVFNTLAQLLVMYGVDRGVVRAAVAGSSALLSVEFDRTVASGSRWRYYELRDPEVGAVLDALGAQGYTPAERGALMALYGTRLRLLQPALAQGAALVNARELAETSMAMAVRQYDDLFLLAQGAEKTLLCLVLDQAEAAEAAGGTPMRRSLAGVSDALLVHASKVLYLRLDGGLTFQSALHRAAWQRVRADHVP